MTADRVGTKTKVIRTAADRERNQNSAGAGSGHSTSQKISSAKRDNNLPS